MTPMGIMFHHFHDEMEHIKEQGSISQNEFREMMIYLGKKYQIVNANEWMEKAAKKELLDNQICITFDDSLKCQFDVALPVLEELGIKAFWFVYTSPLENIIEKLELYRYFRFKNFADIDEFYMRFFETLFETVKLKDSFNEYQEQCKRQEFLKEFLFYSENDRLYRFFRDQILDTETYNAVIDLMMKREKFDIESCKEILWMKKEHIQHLNDNGHVIGLHSHSHPTQITKLDYQQEKAEYKKNQEVLAQIIGNRPSAVSYPCGDYTEDTDLIMKELGIVLGFNATAAYVGSDLHFPRIDHALIMKKLRGD